MPQIARYFVAFGKHPFSYSRSNESADASDENSHFLLPRNALQSELVDDKQKAAKRAYMRAWHAKNKQRVAANLRKRYAEDPEYRARINRHNNAAYRRNPQPVIDRAKRDYARNPEAKKKYIAEWQASNRKRVNGYARTYRLQNVAKCAAAVALWIKKNPDKMSAIRADWKKRNEQRVKTNRMAYRARPENIERERQNKKAWLLANVGRVRQQAIIDAHRRRIRKQGCSGDCTYKQAMLRVEYHGWRCLYCKKILTLSTLTLDHLIPITRGGSNWPSNIAPACKSCNSKKRTRTYSEYVTLLRKRRQECTPPTEQMSRPQSGHPNQVASGRDALSLDPASQQSLFSPSSIQV